MCVMKYTIYMYNVYGDLYTLLPPALTAVLRGCVRNRSNSKKMQLLFIYGFQLPLYSTISVSEVPSTSLYVKSLS